MEFTERAAEQIQATNSSNKENMGRNFSGAPVAAPEGSLSLLAQQARSAVFAIFIYFISVIIYFTPVILLQRKQDLKVCFSKE